MKLKLSITKEETNILKGIAILTVLIAHSADMGVFRHIVPRDFCAWLCRAGMSLFLFLSGYGVFVSYEMNGFKNYWDRKIRKIYIPFIMCQVLLFIWNLIGKNRSFGIKDVFETFLLNEPLIKLDVSMWWLSYIFFWYFLFFLLFQIKDSRISLAMLSLLSVVICVPVMSYWKNASYLCIQFGGGYFGDVILKTKLFKGKWQLSSLY